MRLDGLRRLLLGAFTARGAVFGADPTTIEHIQDKFQDRARALFYSRLAFLAIGLLALVIPAWTRSLGLRLPLAAYAYLTIVSYHAGAYIAIGRRGQKPATFASLCLDILVLIYLVASSGGLRSPLMPTQLVFTLFFALLFPSPLAILPPLLTLPIVAKIDQLLGAHLGASDILLVLWYSALNCMVVWAVVYLNAREEGSFREIVTLQRERRRALLAEERARLAREIHDGLGASLSGVVLQAEYLETQMAADAPLAREVHELRAAAAEGMDELRRAVSMMRDDFDLVPALEDSVAQFGSRHRLETRIESAGVERALDPETQLCLFRVLKEALTNVARHAAARTVTVSVRFDPDLVRLRVADDGRGFDATAAHPGHYGLRNMQERAERAGGSLALTTSVGAGTVVDLALPVRGEA
ncbi:MAG TPA: sensor histidine kinase [Polyangia bacterium]